MPTPPKRSYGATVEPRPKRDGTASYDVRYRIDGNSRRMGFTSPEAAERWAGIVRSIGPHAALDFLKVTSKPGTPTVDEYAEQYISSKSGVEGKTTEHYRMFMRLHIGPAFGHLPLDAVSPAAIAAWVNENFTAGYAGKTIANWHSFMFAMFDAAVEQELVRRNPCAKTRMPTSEREEMVFLSADEFTFLLSYIPPRWEALVMTLAATGMRWGEATALRAGDFDLDGPRPTVRITRAWKSSKAKGYYIGPPKTKKSRRTLTLTAGLVPMIRELIAEGNEYVFTNARGNPVRQAQFWEWVWAPARRLANGQPAFLKARGKTDAPWAARSKGPWEGRVPASEPLGKQPRIHDLRHCYVSWQLASGVGIDVVSRALGHESIQTTVNVYGHISEVRMGHAADAIGITLAGAMPELTE